MNIDGVIEKLKCATRCHPNVIETLINEAIEMLEAEREAVMKQAPRIWRRYAGVIAGSPCFAYREQEPMQDDGFEWVAFYASPLPAQQIPEVTLPEKKPVPDPDISIQAWDGQDFENSAYNNAIDDMAEILINQGYAIRKPAKR